MAVNAEMERSGDSVASQYGEMIGFDIDESTRAPPMRRWRDLAILSRPNLMKSSISIKMSRRVGRQCGDGEVWRFRRVPISRNDRFRYRRVDACAVNAEIKRSGDSVASQHREMIDFDIDESARGPSAQRLRDLAFPSCPIIEKWSISI